MVFVCVCVCVPTCSSSTLYVFFLLQTNLWEKKKENGTSEIENMLIVYISFQHTVINIFHTSFSIKRRKFSISLFFPLYCLVLYSDVVDVVFFSWGPIYIFTIISHLILFFACSWWCCANRSTSVEKPHICDDLLNISMPFSNVCVRSVNTDVLKFVCDDFKMLIK